MEIVGKPRQERRKVPRVQLKEILYVNLDSETGGIVVNLSESGLSFRCATPIQRELQTNDPVRLALLLPQGKQLDIPAEVVWSGQTGKTGGVRFTNLSVAAHGYILNLMDESLPGARPAIAPSTILPAAVPREQPLKAELPHLSPLPSQKAPEAQRPTLVAHVEVPAAKTPEPPTLPAPFPNAESYQRTRVKESWLPPPEEPRSFRGLAMVVLLVVLLAGAGWLVNLHRREVGAAIVELGERLQGTPPVQAVPVSAPPAPTAEAQQITPVAPDVAQTPAEPPPAAAASSTLAPAEPADGAKPKTERRNATRPQEEAHVANASVAPSAADQDAAAADLAAAQRYLDGKERNSSAAAALLWSSLAKGAGPTAELTLARLYLNGDGVAKSCEQARVLLKAASDHGNPEAEQTLAQVNRNRCR